MCHLPLTKGGVRASAAKDLRFSPQGLNIKQFTINMHSNKVFKKAWYACYATQFKAYDMHDVQTIGGQMDNIR